MDLETRKIEFVQAFLKLQSEELISQLENLLKKKTNYEIGEEANFKPMTVNELNERIDQSENDFASGDFKSTSDLLKKYNSVARA
jgi:uncharacterized small protein (DUF1192 family)